MSDIVGQMTREMNLTGDMLDAMQQQQMMQQSVSGMGGMPQQQSTGMDFSQMSPQQQMQMMDAVNQQTQQMPQQMPQAPQYESESDSESNSSNSNSNSTNSDLGDERRINSLGLGSKHGPMGWGDTIVHYLKDPLIIMVIFILLSLTQFDGILKPLLPALINNGLYYIGIKGLSAAVMFFIIKLIIV